MLIYVIDYIILNHDEYLERCMPPYLFANIVLSSSNTVFSFCCNSFSTSAASGSNCGQMDTLHEHCITNLL